MSGWFFMWLRVFFPECFEGCAGFKLNIFHSLRQISFFSPLFRPNLLIFLGHDPPCSLHLSTLLDTVVLSCIVISQCLGEVVLGTRWEWALEALHPWYLGRSGQCGLLTWSSGVRHHLRILQRDTTDWEKPHNAQHSTLGLLRCKAVEKADH